MSVPVKVAVGSHVWAEDPEIAWIDGEVVEANGEELKIICTSGKTVVANASDVYPKDTEAPPDGINDMTKLAYLHEPGVLHNLRCRYDISEIYTYTGTILIAVNPFQRLPHLYGKDVMKQYKGAVFGELSPHPFAVAESAFRLMINEGVSQSILVSGESGAGKTESTKMLMQYLAYMGGRAAAEGRTVEQQVLESNPVLEAFGNAKTVRNNNSSRFGKFVEIQFDPRGRISGAAIRTYLLERSRVCQVSDPERNYHCFYMLCAAPSEVLKRTFEAFRIQQGQHSNRSPSDDVEKYKLGDPRKFHYLNQSNCYELDGVDDSKEYIATRRAMDVVGISSDEQDAIFRVVAALLHLGNIEFAKGQEIDSSEPKDDKSRFHLRMAAELFMCDEKSLEDSLCKRVIVTRDETITKWLDPDSAAVSRDALAKIVYSRLFDWIVDKINNSIGQDPDSKVLIGVLDIYGFESFKTNSFEQFCINLTNEKLQQHFNQHVFKMEQEEYTREEIEWSYIEYVDNQDILDLIEKKPGGIIALLDEACMFPRSTHETFSQKLYQTFKSHKRFRKPKLSPTDFTIYHYAGDVTYQTEYFLDKNKDYVVAEHQSLLSASRCPFVANLFPPLPEESSKTSKFSSIGSRFKQQLQSLLETLSATEPHYVRCVKPNNLLKPSIFENNNVLQQLRCGGVLEAIRISCAGFPTRRTFDEFNARFSILAPDVLNGSCNEATASKRILEKVGLKGYQIGKTKVFLRAGQLADLDARRNEVLGKSASIIQRKVRSYLAHKSFVLLRHSAIQIQASCRVQVARHQYNKMRKEAACRTIQKDLRMHVARKEYNRLCSSAVSIQTGMRVMGARNELHFRKQTKAAIIIQSRCRGFLAHLHYLRIKKVAVATQCVMRGRVARRELHQLKMAAKETGALQAAKTMLEKQVEELTCQLQLEKRMRADIEEANTQEYAKLQNALEEMQVQFQEAEEMLIKECENAKKAAEKERENATLQNALEEMQVQFQEAKEMLIKERENAKKADEKERENATLQNALQEIQVQFQEAKEMLIKERENAKKANEKELENATLQNALQEMQVQFQEAKEMLIKERENAKKTDEKERENATLQNALQEAKELLIKEHENAKKVDEKECENAALQNALQEAKEMLIKERETAKKTDEKERENATLQNALQEMQVQLQEAKGMLIKERENAKNADDKERESSTLQNTLQEMQDQFQEAKEMLIKEHENAKNADAKERENAINADDKECERATLQNTLQEMQVQFQEAKEMLIKEPKNAKKEDEKVPIIQKVPVIDHEMINKLTAENEKLKDLVSSLEKKIDETERKYEEANKISEECLKQALDAESKIIQLKTDMQRLEEKLSDMEMEDQALRQQVLLQSPNRKMSEHLAIASEPHLENGRLAIEEKKTSEPESTTPVIKFGTEADNKLRRSQIERLHETVDALIKCVSQDLGFSNGKPVAAFTIYKCLLHWKSFEAEKTSVFDRLIQIVGSAFENGDNNEHMAYWLSNASTLLLLLQRSLKTTGQQKPPLAPSLFGRMAQGFRSSFSSANVSVDVVRQVEAKYPALLFKQQLTAYVETIYGIIRDNVKKDLSFVLSSCIQDPESSESSGQSPGHSPLASRWQSIIKSLNELLSTLTENFVSPVLIQKMFSQIFSYINVQLFNSLLLHRECCTFRNGEYVKSGLDELELWCGQTKEEYVGSSWDELKHLRQAVGFLVIHQKSRISYDDLANDLCPILSVQQLYRISTLYGDDDYNTPSVAPDVISSMQALMPKDGSSDTTNNSFLLDDNSSIPFSVDEISSSNHGKDFSDVKPAAQLLENQAFQFLQE